MELALLATLICATSNPDRALSAYREGGYFDKRDVGLHDGRSFDSWILGWYFFIWLFTLRVQLAAFDRMESHIRQRPFRQPANSDTPQLHH